MQTAITRQPPAKGRDHPAFLPEERMTLDECVKGYTVNAAAAALIVVLVNSGLCVMCFVFISKSLAKKMGDIVQIHDAKKC